MAARAFTAGPIAFDNTTTTAILQYNGNYTPSSSPSFPALPYYNDTSSAYNFIFSLRSLVSENHPVYVPIHLKKRLESTIAIKTFPCYPNGTCQGPNGTRLAASMNNISFVIPQRFDILEAYYYHINGVYKKNFPSFPPFVFNFTEDYPPLYLNTPKRGTEVKVLKYNSTVQMVLQGTNLVAGLDHPMHLHGFSFYVVGWGLGNFDKHNDTKNFNLVDPPFRNTAIVPRKGWIAVRFKASNPGVWFMHCHLDRHLTWGMDMAFIVKNGKSPQTSLLPPPPDMPPC
ncbi:unnamed protein product [Ilex paraguariensis]|uniref:Plastocyanin-like domain-containing protein n=1 Tax=Ilex paraguariensis TaxID=185542 RepID=A0ABC8TWW2_9AQUA